MSQAENVTCPVCSGIPASGADGAHRCAQCGFTARQLSDGVWDLGSSAEVSMPEDGHAHHAAVADSSFWFAHRNDVIADIVDWFPPPGPIWDVGGGTGIVARGLEARGWSTVLIEPGPVGARVAKQRGLAHVIRGRVEDGQLGAAPLPAVGLFDVIEHIEDDVGMLRIIHDKLQPGGLCYVTVLALPTLWSSVDVGAGHFRRYTRRTLRQALTAADLQVRYVSYFMGPLVPPLFLLRALPDRLRGLKMEQEEALADVRARGRHMQHQAKGRLGAGLLIAALVLERRVMQYTRLPFGTSVIAVAQRADGTAAG